MKKHRPGTRLFSLLLILTLCLAALPLQAFAEEPAPPEAGAENETREDPAGPGENPAAPEDSDKTGPYALEALRPGLLTARAGDAYSRGRWLQELEQVFGLTADADQYPDVYYPDIEGTDYFDAVMTAVTHGLSDVEPGDPFEPEGPLTRDWAAHTLNFLLGLQPKGDGYTFSDSGETEYPGDAQAVVDAGWLASAGGKFLPGQAVTEAEAQAMLDGAAEIMDGRNTSHPHHDYEFASYVKVIPDSAAVESDFDIETNARTVTVSGYDGTLENGDVFVYYYDDYAFVFAAESVHQAGGVYTIETAPAPEGAVLKYEYSGTLSPEITEFIPNNTPVTLAEADGGTVTFGEVRSVVIRNKEIKFDRDVLKSNGLSGTLSGMIHINGLDVDVLGSDKRAILSGTIDITSTIEFDALNAPKGGLELAGVKLGEFGYVGLVLDLKMKVDMSYSWSASFRAGVEYTNGTGSLVKELSASKNNCFSAEGEVSAQLSLTAFIDLGPGGFAKAEMGAGPRMSAGMKTYASGSPRTCVSLTGYFYAGAVFNVRLINPFTNKTLYSINKTWTFYNEKNSPIRVCLHKEDGVSVGSCTRGNDSGATSGGYTRPKYITPANSRYYASGSSSGSSTWTGTGGEAVVIWTTEPNENGGVTVTGYKGGASVVNIPETIDGETVTAIGSGAFRNNRSIRIVNIPDTVVSIGSSAFFGCTNLRTVTFSRNLTEIGSSAFNGSGLVRAQLPETLTSLGANAFRECPALAHAYIPSGLSKADWPFWGCKSLDNIVFGTGISTIPSSLFQNCTGLTHIEIPDTVVSIGSFAFFGCTNLRTVTFSRNLTEIGSSAFNGSGLVRAQLPETLTSLDANAFRECPALAYAYIPSGLSKADWPFWGCKSLDNIVFGTGISAIPSSLFQNCTGLTHIEIPDTVVSIGSSAFFGCTNLRTVTFSRNLTEIGSSAFNGSGLVTVTVPDTITKYPSAIFRDCAKLTMATLSRNAPELPVYMFSGCTSLKTVSLPDGVKEIPYAAFQNCAALENLDFLPASVTSIRAYAFQGCTGMTSARLPDSVTELGSSTTQGAVFQGCSSLTSFQSSPALKTIGVNCFQNCSSLTDVTLNRGLREIGSYAFQNCAALEEIVLPDTVTGVGSYIFQGDPKLARVTLSKGLSEIPSYAFAGCTALERLDIPQGVKTVRDHAFYQDTALKTFTIPQSVTSIESNAFSYPTSTTVYGVPGSYAETFARWKEFIPITIVPVTGLVLDRTELTLTEGGSQALTASVLPGDATNRTVLWSTNNTAVVEVSPDGVVIAKKAGRATVTAKTADGGYTASCTVTVTAAPVQPDPEPPSGNTMGPKNELTWARNGRTLTVTGPVSAAEPLWAAAYDQNGRLLSVSPVTASGGSARLPDGAASVRLIWTDPGRAPKCASAFVMK